MKPPGRVGRILGTGGLRRGTHDQVAVDGGRDQNSLPHRAGALENHPAYTGSLALVQQIILPLGRTDGEGLFPDQLVDPVRIYPGGVDDVPAVEHAFRCGNGKALPLPGDGGGGTAQMERRSVAYRRLRHGQGVLPGIHDGGGGGQQGLQHLSAQFRLQGPGLVPGEDAQACHAVALPPLQQGPQQGPVLLAESQHQASGLSIGHVKLGTDFLRHTHALHVQSGHSRVRLRVVASVKDGAVGLGGASGHIAEGLQHREAQPEPAQSVSTGRAHHAAADNDDILHKISSRLHAPRQAGGGPLAPIL